MIWDEIILRQKGKTEGKKFTYNFRVLCLKTYLNPSLIPDFQNVLNLIIELCFRFILAPKLSNAIISYTQYVVWSQF